MIIYLPKVNRIFLLAKAKAAGSSGDFAKKLPNICSQVTDERLSARLQYCTEASQTLPQGALETKRHSYSLLIEPPNTHVKRKRTSDGQCGAPPSKTARYMMGPQDFINCMQSYLAANFSKSCENIVPLAVAETILARYHAKVPGPSTSLTSSQPAKEPEAVECPQPAPEIETENAENEPTLPIVSPSSMSEEPTAGPSQPKPGLSSRQKGMEYKKSNHKSILQGDSLVLTKCSGLPLCSQSIYRAMKGVKIPHTR